MLELSKSDISPPKLLQLQINTSTLFTFLIKYPRHDFVHSLYYTLTVHTQPPGQNHVFKNMIFARLLNSDRTVWSDRINQKPFMDSLNSKNRPTQESQ